MTETRNPQEPPCPHCLGFSGKWLESRIRASTQDTQEVARYLSVSKQWFDMLLAEDWPVPLMWASQLQMRGVITTKECDDIRAARPLHDGQWLRKLRVVRGLELGPVAGAVGVPVKCLRYLEANEWPIPCSWFPGLAKMGLQVHAPHAPVSAQPPASSGPPDTDGWPLFSQPANRQAADILVGIDFWARFVSDSRVILIRLDQEYARLELGENGWEQVWPAPRTPVPEFLEPTLEYAVKIQKNVF